MVRPLGYDPRISAVKGRRVCQLLYRRQIMSIQRVNRVSRSFYIERPAVVTRNLESLSPHTFKCAHLGIIRIPRLLSQVGRLFPLPFTRPFFASPVLNGVHLRGLNSDSGNTHISVNHIVLFLAYPIILCPSSSNDVALIT